MGRVIQKEVRRYLYYTGALMVFWIVLRTLKYDFINDSLLLHWIWYFYYVAIILIPLLTLFVARSICCSEEYRLPTIWKLLMIPAVILVLLVLTNDLHGLVFILPPDQQMNPSTGTYGYGAVYFIIVACVGLCYTVAFIIIFAKNRMMQKKTRIWIPAGCLLLMGIYLVFYALYPPFISRFFADFNVVYCLCLTAFFESLLKLRMIQSNSHYVELFRCLELPAVIVDQAYKEMVATAAYSGVAVDDMRKAEGDPVVLDGAVRLSLASIRGGRVLWQDDVSELSGILDHLQEVQETRSEENDLLAEEIELRTRRAHIEEQNRLYDEMQRQTEGQISLMNDLTTAFEQAKTEEEKRRLLGKIVVVGAYLKRRNNLIFISDKEPYPNIKELELSFLESVKNLQLYGVECGFSNVLTGSLPADEIMHMYDFFEEVVEASLDTMSAMQVVIGHGKQGRFITITTDSNADLSFLAGADRTILQDDDDEWTLTMITGGEEA